MTARAKEPRAAMRCPSPLVLFGIDSRGKPKAARFRKEHAGLAMKAATQLQLNVLASSDPKVAEIVARLPVGRVHVTGRTFVPFIRRDLTTSWSPPPRTAISISRQPLQRAGQAAMLPGRGHPGRGRTFRAIGRRSVSAIWFSPKRRIRRTAGTKRLSSKLPTTCSRCAGVTFRCNASLCAIGCGSACSIRGPNRARRSADRGKHQPTDGTTKQSRPIPSQATMGCPKSGMRSMSIISCWPKPKVRGRTGSRPFQSRERATASSCAGGTTPPCRRSSGHDSSWP
jgi:hypothetical protein